MAQAQNRFNQAKFVRSYGASAQLPPSTLAEVSFAGRSNVGKSSLMNRLFDRKSLVKVSSVPGKTSNINFFEAANIYFVDLPGYGYAKVSKAEKGRWSEMIEGYFSQNRRFSLVVLLVDIRIAVQKLDIAMVDFLKTYNLPFVVVFTKADKLSKNKQAQAAKNLCEGLGVDLDDTFTTSAQTGAGVDLLRKKILDAVNSNK